MPKRKRNSSESEAEQFLIRSLKFLQNVDGSWIRPPSIEPTRWLEECGQILESQRVARRAFVLKRISALHLPDEIPESQLEFFALLQWRLTSDFQLSDFENDIVKAVSSNDYRFFMSFGKVLEKPPTSDGSNLELLLLQNWTDSQFGTPPFCFFTDAALAEAIGERATFDALRKIRQRAGLVQGSIYQVTKATRVGDQWKCNLNLRPKGRSSQKGTGN